MRSNAVRALGKFGEEGESAPLLSLLDADDNYTRDAARTILEQQGFLDQHLLALEATDFKAKSRARHFFIKMAEQGNSVIAKEVVKKYHLDEIPSIPSNHHESGSTMNDYAISGSALGDQKGP